ncbi:uncharacterized protein MYCFIDRAFT_177571 [Pseudocercospora fijiensis CIRAD86]|uniref:Uncharacterized protein n=1 Tax=Pseudocercospora fijiensis (strain CIRAD86) TaxID=383855 RepID=M2ZNG7_PSEFD|nr:uncharacterized protein MYCFIDRAFT_177571 [Pseudocercospora fijiensis CIRAD86]EME80639.1 hypothetical protein MYCFIDRAFT_177571 [Pseudocercospora fijiensis CIRAD86]
MYWGTALRRPPLGHGKLISTRPTTSPSRHSCTHVPLHRRLAAATSLSHFTFASFERDTVTFADFSPSALWAHSLYKPLERTFLYHATVVELADFLLQSGSSTENDDDKPTIADGSNTKPMSEKARGKMIAALPPAPIGTHNGTPSPSIPPVTFTTDTGPQVEWKGGHYIRIANIAKDTYADLFIPPVTFTTDTKRSDGSNTKPTREKARDTTARLSSASIGTHNRTPSPSIPPVTFTTDTDHSNARLPPASIGTRNGTPSPSIPPVTFTTDTDPPDGYNTKAMWCLGLCLLSLLPERHHLTALQQARHRDHSLQGLLHGFGQGWLESRAGRERIGGWSCCSIDWNDGMIVYLEGINVVVLFALHSTCLAVQWSCIYFSAALRYHRRRRSPMSLTQAQYRQASAGGSFLTMLLLSPRITVRHILFVLLHPCYAFAHPFHPLNLHLSVVDSNSVGISFLRTVGRRGRDSGEWEGKREEARSSGFYYLVSALSSGLLTPERGFRVKIAGFCEQNLSERTFFSKVAREIDSCAGRVVSEEWACVVAHARLRMKYSHLLPSDNHKQTLPWGATNASLQVIRNRLVDGELSVLELPPCGIALCAVLGSLALSADTRLKSGVHAVHREGRNYLGRCLAGGQDAISSVASLGKCVLTVFCLGLKLFLAMSSSFPLSSVLSSRGRLSSCHSLKSFAGAAQRMAPECLSLGSDARLDDIGLFAVCARLHELCYGESCVVSLIGGRPLTVTVYVCSIFLPERIFTSFRHLRARRSRGVEHRLLAKSRKYVSREHRAIPTGLIHAHYEVLVPHAQPLSVNICSVTNFSMSTSASSNRKRTPRDQATGQDAVITMAMKLLLQGIANSDNMMKNGFNTKSTATISSLFLRRTAERLSRPWREKEEEVEREKDIQGACWDGFRPLYYYEKRVKPIERERTMAPQQPLPSKDYVNIGDDAGYPGRRKFLENRLAINYRLYRTKKDYAFQYSGGWGLRSRYATKWFEHCLKLYMKIYRLMEDFDEEGEKGEGEEEAEEEGEDSEMKGRLCCEPIQGRCAMFCLPPSTVYSAHAPFVLLYQRAADRERDCDASPSSGIHRLADVVVRRSSSKFSNYASSPPKSAKLYLKAEHGIVSTYYGGAEVTVLVFIGLYVVRSSISEIS